MPVHGDILDHPRVGVEPQLAMPAPARFVLNEAQQTPPQPLALRRRVDRDVVEQRETGVVLDDDEPDDAPWPSSTQTCPAAMRFA
jgi:hypothetical protein